MYGKLTSREGRDVVNNPDKVKVFAVFEEHGMKRYVIEAKWSGAQHPRSYLKDEKTETIYYNDEVETMREGFFWLFGNEVELYDISTNRSAKTLLQEEY